LSKSYRSVKIEIWKCYACLTEKSYIEPVLKVKKLSVTGHQAEANACLQWGQVCKGTFPAGGSQLVQYGPQIKAQKVYFSQ
jgi:hypothetical protein